MDVGIEIGVTSEGGGSPPAVYSFYRKGEKAAFQTVEVDAISMWDEEPKGQRDPGL